MTTDVTSSVGPEMKFFRWILSHLTLILLLSLLIYLFWNRNEMWSEETIAEKIIEQPVTKQIEITKDDEVAHDFVGGSILQDTDTIAKNIDSDENNLSPIDSSIEDSEGSRSSSGFSKRMSHYREMLPADEREDMDKAEEIFQQVTDGTIKFPSQSDIEMVTDASEQLLQKPIEVSEDELATIKMDQYPTEIIQSDTGIDSQDGVGDFPEYEAPEYEVLNDIVEQPIQEIQTNPPVLDKRSNLNSKSQSINVRTKDAHTQNLQYQIRNRQRELQNQMVMLVPLSNTKSSNALSNKVNKDLRSNTRNKKSSNPFKSIKPVINTPEQRIMLKEARTAFDKQDFTQAEAKYRQVMQELPELPDVVGELANVYRTQNKTSDYLATNTLFVKRLVNHNRLDEAWNVVKMTSSLNKEIAEQQRKIILRKQAQ